MRLPALAGSLVLGMASPVAAQQAPSATLAIGTDEARRGLSWSGGRAVAAADVEGSLGPIEGSARAVTTRDSTRHAGAEAAVDLGLATRWDLGAIELRAEAVSHVFVGAREQMNYVEAGASAGYGYGPLYATLGAMMAPAQRAIGGSNLYLYASANAGIPGTPLTLLARVGRSSGSVSDVERAERLRPGGTYEDWRFGIEHRRDALTFGLDYVGTNSLQSILPGRFADPQNGNDRLVGRIEVAL